MFQKRHYQRIAKIIRALPADARVQAAREFSEMLMLDNSKFNSHTFFEACGVRLDVTLEVIP